jgi:hypothetical protein
MNRMQFLCKTIIHLTPIFIGKYIEKNLDLKKKKIYTERNLYKSKIFLFVIEIRKSANLGL